MKAGDATWHKVFERDKGICQYCDMDLLQDFEHYQMSSVDHVVSRAQNGEENETGNLVLCCHGCNTRLSRAHHLKTVDSRREFLKTSSPGARGSYSMYLEKKRSQGW